MERFCVPSAGIDNIDAGKRMSERGGMMELPAVSCQQGALGHLFYRLNIWKMGTNFIG